MEESSQQQLQQLGRHSYTSDDNRAPLKDLSIQNASGSHDGSLADSGYTSYQSFNHSCSVVTRSVLATIVEDNEAAADSSSFEESPVVAATRYSETPLKIHSILTPTTAASCEQISNFHLTTPNSTSKELTQNRRALVRKPTCQNLFAEQRTPKKMFDDDHDGENSYPAAGNTPIRSGRKSELEGILTPRKNRSSAKRKLPSSFREKLYPDELDDQRDSLDCKKLDHGEISPIPHNKRRRNSAIDDCMRSSTPKTASFLAQSQENVDWSAMQPVKPSEKVRFKKYQSFSPSKMHSYRKRDTVLQEKAVVANRKARPLTRQNALQENSFSQLVTPPKKRESDQSFDLVAAEAAASPAKKTLNLSALLEAPILPQTETDLEREVAQLPSFNDCSSFIPEQPPEEDSVLRDAPVQAERSIVSLLEGESPPFLFSPSIPRTPTSAGKSRHKLKRLTSRALSSTSSVSSSSAKKDKSKSILSSPKHVRSQPVIQGKKRLFYDGVERLNILKCLDEHDKDALEIVLEHLTDADLVRVVAVSRGWRYIIKTHRRTNRRLRDYLSREAHSKENWDRSAAVLGRDDSKVLLGSCGDAVVGKPVVPRQPFSMCNSIDGNQSVVSNTSVSQKSPPVSPSRRKFHENQKIASHLKKSEKLTGCPRCGKPSRVLLTKLRPAVRARPLEKSFTLPDYLDSPPSSPTNDNNNSIANNSSLKRIRKDLFSTSGAAAPIRSYSLETTTSTGSITRSASRRSSADLERSVNRRSNAGRRQSVTTSPSSEESQQKQQQGHYAVCTGKNCAFEFCVKCLCEHHPNRVCKDLAPNSPSKEEDEPARYVACSKQSRRSLRRLCN